MEDFLTEMEEKLIKQKNSVLSIPFFSVASVFFISSKERLQNIKNGQQTDQKIAGKAQK